MTPARLNDALISSPALKDAGRRIYLDKSACNAERNQGNLKGRQSPGERPFRAKYPHASFSCRKQMGAPLWQPPRHPLGEADQRVRRNGL